MPMLALVSSMPMPSYGIYMNVRTIYLFYSVFGAIGENKHFILLLPPQWTPP
jgi:hypothetical protein